MSSARSGIGVVLVLVAIAVPAVVAGEAGGQQVRVVFRGGAQPSRALVEVVSQAGAAGSEAVEVAVSGGVGGASVALEGQGSWRFRASAPGWWSPEVVVAAPSEEPVELVLWPGALVEAEMGVAGDDVEPINEVQLTLSRIAELPQEAGEQPERAEVVCPTSDEHLRDCSVPAGRWHLRIKAAGYMPQFRWDTEIPHTEAFDLGRLVFKKGSSLFGRVVTSDGAPCPHDARAVLRPLVDRNLGGREDLAAQLDSLTDEAPVNEWGYFHFGGIVSRTYQLTAGGAGYLPSTARQVVVGTGQQVELDEPLVLVRGVRLTVIVQPCRDEVADPLDVELFRWSAVEERKKVAEGAAADGEWTSPPLPPGSYAIKVANERGDRLVLRQVELTGDGQVSWIDLECVNTSGTVTRGGEPLPATLTFSSESSRVSTQSDREGRFTVVFPRPGRWEVSVSSPEHELECRGFAVEILPDHAEELEIEVPDTAVRGEVVFSNGSAVGGALVKLVGVADDGIGAYYTDGSGSDGRFELQGVLPGTYKVEASWQSLHSGIETTTVEEDVTAPPVQLVLRESWVLRGVVLAGSQPVPGATVMTLPFTAEGTFASNVTPLARSGIDGSFALEMPHSCTTVRVAVMAPGFTLQVATTTRAIQDDGSAFVVALESGGGSLRLARTSQYGVVVVDGSPIPTGFLTQWAMVNGQPTRASDEVYTIPAMPAGAYGFCDLTPDEAMLVMAAVAVPTRERCAEGFLGEGEVLSLEAPVR